MAENVVWGVSLIACYFALRTLQLCRRTNCLKELLRREQEQSFARYNEIVRTLTGQFLQGPEPSLESLAKDIETDFTRTSSRKP